MRLFTRIVLALTLLALITTMAACGGQPATFAEIPIPAEAQPLAAGENKLADQMASNLTKSLSANSSATEVKMYTLPQAIGWDQLKGFYSEKLAGTDWKNEAELSQETEIFKMAFWDRGSFASEQGLAVGYVPSLPGSSPLLMVALISE